MYIKPNQIVYYSMLGVLFILGLICTYLVLNAVKKSQDVSYANQDYIKCIVLMRYDNPHINQNSPKAEVELALDKCASRVRDEPN